MPKSKAHKVLRILTSVFLVLILGGAGFAFWLAHDYKQLIMERLPEMVARSSDSIYHISFSDVSVSLRNHDVTLTGVKLWADEKQAAALRARQHYIPPTLSDVSIPHLEAYGIDWGSLVKNRTLSCKTVDVHDLKWIMKCTPHPGDSLFTHDEKKSPAISRITSAQVNFFNPDITYQYDGPREHFDCFMKGGTAVLSDFAYDYDKTKDTSAFLYARSGKVRFKEFIFSKPAGRYVVKTPDLDFETNANTVTLRSVKIKNMADYDQQTSKEKENYTLSFPAIDLVDFNWNKLINNGVLRISAVHALEPSIAIRYIRENNPVNGRTGSFPNQLLLKVGLKTNIHELDIKSGHFTYTEVTKKGAEAVIDFTNINGSFQNITNLPKVIEKKKSCIVKLQGKFMKKSDIMVTFDMPLTDSTGRYTIDGYVTNLEGSDVAPQAQVFTIVKVTSFHLDRMDMHITGDDRYGKGAFTVRYKDLKISLLKFDTKAREGKKGPFAFLGSALLLYPSNPMPDKDVRKVSTSFARDTTKGFIGSIWQHMFRAAKKTAVREQAIVTLTDGPETNRGDKPKKGFFKRIFAKKKGK